MINQISNFFTSCTLKTNFAQNLQIIPSVKMVQGKQQDTRCNWFAGAWPQKLWTLLFLYNITNTEIFSFQFLYLHIYNKLAVIHTIFLKSGLIKLPHNPSLHTSKATGIIPNWSNIKLQKFKIVAHNAPTELVWKDYNKLVLTRTICCANTYQTFVYKTLKLMNWLTITSKHLQKK